jgi:hypothetical protein
VTPRLARMLWCGRACHHSLPREDTAPPSDQRTRTQTHTQPRQVTDTFPIHNQRDLREAGTFGGWGTDRARSPKRFSKCSHPLQIPPTLAAPSPPYGAPIGDLYASDLYKVHGGCTQEASTEPAPTPNVYLGKPDSHLDFSWKPRRASFVHSARQHIDQHLPGRTNQGLSVVSVV